MADGASIEELTRAECLRAMATEPVGRLAINMADGFPLVAPVNFLLDGESIVFRTGAGTKLGNVHQNVSFEVDHIDREMHTGWSVLDVSAGSDGKSRLLWNNNGTAGLWSVDNSGNITSGVTFGPYSGWSPARIYAGSDSNNPLSTAVPHPDLVMPPRTWLLTEGPARARRRPKHSRNPRTRTT